MATAARPRLGSTSSPLALVRRFDMAILVALLLAALGIFLEWRLSILPLLRPVLDPGLLRSAASQANSRHVAVQLEDDVLAEADIPDSYQGPPLNLKATGNLAELRAQQLANGLLTVRFIELTLIDAVTGRPVEVPGVKVVIRLAIRPMDVREAGGDLSRLMLLHYRPATRAWEDTQAVAAGNYLEATVDSLSPFAVVVGKSGQTTVIGIAPEPGPDRAADTPSEERADEAPGAAKDGDAPGAPSPAGPVRASAPASPTARASAAPAGPLDAPSVPPAPVSAPAPPPPSVAASAPPSISPSGSSSGGSSSAATPTPTPTPAPVAVLSITTPGSGSAILSRSAFVPGDQWRYNLVVANAGSGSFSYAFSTSPQTSSALDNPASIGLPAASGLQLRIARCSAGFTACPTVIYDGPVQITNQSIGSLTSGSQDPLQLTVQLPSAGGNVYQGLASSIDLVWTAQSQ